MSPLTDLTGSDWANIVTRVSVAVTGVIASVILCRDSVDLNSQLLISLPVSAVLCCRSRSDLDI